MPASARYELVVRSSPGEGRAFTVQGSTSFGSAAGNTVRINDPAVQPSHAVVEPFGALLRVRHVGTGGATLVDGAPITSAEVGEGALVQLGRVQLQVRLVEASRSAPVDTRLRPSGATTAVSTSDTLLRPSGTRPAVTPEPSLDDDPPPPALEPTVMKAAPTAPSGELREGDVIDGRYRIVAHLASGGMGEVYRAEHVELGKVCALKVMKKELSADQEFVDRFKREAVASSRIGQHNIVDIFDFGRTQAGRFYFVMEFLDGPTLSDIIRDERVLTVPRAANLVQQIARALGAAHQRGIVHRDLKPENVIVLRRDQGDFVKVVDFGVAKVADQRGQSGQTAYGLVVGTPQYMSPEQAAGLPVDARSDIYSLGLIAWELIAGRVVFDGATPSMVMAAHITQAAPPLVAGLADSVVSDELNHTIMRMLEKQKEARPSSMEEVVSVFEQVVAQASAERATKVRTGAIPLVHEHHVSPSGSRPPARGSARVASASGSSVERASAAEAEAPLQRPRRSRALLLLGGAGLLVVFGVAAAALLPSGGAPSTQPAPAVITPSPAPKVVETPTPPVEPAPGPSVKLELVQVRIISKPDQAEVFDGDTLIGTTPLALTWEKGKPLKLGVKKTGFVDATRSVSPEGNLNLELELTPLKRAGGAPSSSMPPRGRDDLRDAPY